MTKVSDPIMIRNVEVKNRLYAPPLISNLAREDLIASQPLIESTYRRAKGGWGLVCTESSIISEKTKLFPRSMAIYDNIQVLGLHELAEAIHGGGSKAMIQLHHPGRECNPALLPSHIEHVALAPSDTTPPCALLGSPKTRGLTEEEIWGIIDDYAKAATRAKAAGYDMVEVHAAHGFLPQQFLSPFTNHRNDKWGGDWGRRLEFIRQLITKMRDTIGDYPIAIRLSADEFVEGGYDIDDFCRYILPAVEEAGYDMLDVTCGVFDNFATVMPEVYEPRGVWTYLAERVKKLAHIPVAGLSRINDGRMAVRFIEKDQFDLVGIGRGSIADHEFARKTLEGRYDEIRRCTACNSCLERIFSNKPGRCAVNFSYGRTNIWDEEHLLPSIKAKDIMVVGAGPAGMEFARVATKRGHKVTVYEKSSHTGGCLRLAASFPRIRTGDLMTIATWLRRQLDDAGVSIKTNTEVTADFIDHEKPDAVVLATGSKVDIPDLPGITGPNVITIDQYLTGNRNVGKNIVIIGGHYGAELGASLGREGKIIPKNNFAKYHLSPKERILKISDPDKVKNVTIIEEGDTIGWPPYMLMTRNIALNEFLEEAGVKCLTNVKVEEVTTDSVRYVASDGKVYRIPADTVVVATGREGNRNLYHQLAGKGIECYKIGDCTGPEKIDKAIRDANFVARQI